MELIGEILETRQPDIYKQFNKEKKRKRKRKKRREANNEYLSFSAIDRMMRNNPGIDERKCW